jgi:hypothetical protein
MSRRHHGRSRHTASRRPRPDVATGDLPAAGTTPVVSDGQPGPSTASRATQAETAPSASPSAEPAPIAPIAAPPVNGHAPMAANRGPGPAPNGGNGANGAQPANGCTAPQLRRFIKSRPYVPMHELRRRFGIDGNDDDVTQVRLDGSAIYVGLPPREGSLLGELLRGGEIGYELSLDPRTPIVVGVYPMRPVPRP